MREDTVNELIQNCYQELQRKKDALVKLKLKEKGFEHLIEGMASKRFPKVCCVNQDGWSFFFADNDTTDGAFIVAIEDYKLTTDTEFDNNNMKVSFNWQDKKLPVIFSRLRSWIKNR